MQKGSALSPVVDLWASLHHLMLQHSSVVIRVVSVLADNEGILAECTQSFLDAIAQSNLHVCFVRVGLALVALTYGELQ